MSNMNSRFNASPEIDVMTGEGEDIFLGQEMTAIQDRIDQAQRLADMIESRALAHLASSADDSKRAMEDRLKTWSLDEGRYHSERVRITEDNWFMNINPPRGARIIDLHRARMMQAITPDTHRLDFFRLSPKSEQPEGQMPTEQDALYAQLAEFGLRNNLEEGDFIDNLDGFVMDSLMTGQGYFLAAWEIDIQFRYENMPNPEFNPAIAPEENVKLDIVDGVEVTTPIKPFLRKRIPVRQFDAPKLRHLKSANVFPTELDRNGIEDCTGVFVYDTCRLSDLRDNEIESGGYFYANLGRLTLASERSDIAQVPSADRETSKATSSRTRAEVAKALDRMTYIGRLRLDELIEELGLVEDMASEVGDMAKDLLAKKFDWDVEKLENWNTWIAEMVDSNRVLARWQPSPYETDRIPVVQHRLFSVPKCTLGDSIYDRIREEEHVRNRMGQLRMMHTQKMIEPPVMIVKDNVDPKWWNAMGGSLKYRRNMMIPGLKGASINQTIQPMEFSPVPLQVADAAMEKMDAQISESSHLPAVRQGLSSGGQTATEVSQMGASSDVMTDYLAKRAERAVEKAFEWMLLLHHQYSEEPRIVHYYDPSGDLVFNEVPPEVWTRNYKVRLTGWESIGNRDVRAMNFQEFAKVAQSYGWQNEEAILAKYAEILQVRDPMRMIKQPEPQEKGATLSSSTSIALNHELLPASVVANLLRKRDGIEITPEEEQQMREMERARAIREVADQANVPIAMAEALPPSWNPNPQQQQPQAQPMPGMPGIPGAAPGAATPEDLRDHHAPGEMESRQRGLHDEIGLQNSISKLLRNPGNSRRAKG